MCFYKCSQAWIGNVISLPLTQLSAGTYDFTVIDSIGSQEIVVDNNFIVLPNFSGNLPRRPKTAVINLSLTDKNGKNYIQTFNYKE